MLLISETLQNPSSPGPVFPKIYPEIDQDILTESEKFSEGQPYQLFARLRAQAPVSWQREGSNGPGFWALTRYEDVMDLDAAIHQPRIDASEGAIVIGDVRLPLPIHDALHARFDYEQARIQNFPMKFACPSVVMRQGTTNSGATESAQPWGDAVAEA